MNLRIFFRIFSITDSYSYTSEYMKISSDVTINSIEVTASTTYHLDDHINDYSLGLIFKILNHFLAFRVRSVIKLIN